MITITSSSMSIEFLKGVLDGHTEDEKWAAIGQLRNLLLAESDWTQSPDVSLTLAEKTSWSDYRQALRDIPQTYATPEEVIWPEKPGGA